MADERKKVSDTIGRRNASRDWLRNNYWNEWEEVWRFFKCRTEPIMNSTTGKEDETRTNLAMPDGWIIGRRKAARLSRRPPNIRVRSKNPDLSQRLSAWTAYQWDRTDEQRFQRRHVLQAVLFGLSLKEYSWDEVSTFYRFRRSTENLLRKAGVVVNEDDEGTGYAVPDGTVDTEKVVPFHKFNSTQQAEILSQLSPDTFNREKVIKYEGPVPSWVFIGDYYPEPEFTGVHEASWNIIDGMKDLTWLAYWANKTFKDPDTGKEYPVFSKAAVQELADMATYVPKRDEDTDFKSRLLAVLNKERPETSLALSPVKKFLITKEYTLKDGWPHIRFIGNEKVLLTPTDIPLPWDLYGHYPLAALTPIPDLLFGIGDSSPRILRHLIRLHNVTVGQRTDYLNQVLKPLALVRDGADIPGEVIDRGLMRVLKVRNPADYQIERMPPVPPEAFSTEQQILRMLQMGEPAVIDFGPGSQAVPSSQRVATLGVLQARAQESLSADELDALNESLAFETQLKLWMLQQSMQDTVNFPEVQNYALSTTTTGEPRKIKLDRMEIQEDFEVFPEFGSTLGLDDADRQKRALEIWDMAAQAPNVFNVHEAGRRIAVASGVTDPESLVLPEPPPQRPMPPIRINFSFTDKWSELEPELKAKLLEDAGLGGLPTAVHREATRRVEKNLDLSKKVLDMAETAHGMHLNEKESNQIPKLRDEYGPNTGGGE